MLKDVSNVEQGFLVISIHDNTLLSLSNKHNHQLHKIGRMASFIEVIIEPTNLIACKCFVSITTQLVVLLLILAGALQTKDQGSFPVSSTRSGLILEHKDSLFEYLAKNRGVYTVALKVMTSRYMTFNSSEQALCLSWAVSILLPTLKSTQQLFVHACYSQNFLQSV